MEKPLTGLTHLRIESNDMKDQVMKIEFDEIKRRTTLEERGLDFTDLAVVFNGPKLTVLDDREEYGETRWITFGYLDEKLVVVVWTKRKTARRIISLRKANGREKRKFQKALGQS